MQIETVSQNIVAVHSEEILIYDVQSALDLMMTVQYETGCKCIILNKQAICEDFFILSTCLAGEILQKFVNYGVQLAICGDFSKYTSKPLRDFIHESNRRRNIFFLPDRNAAIERLTSVQ